MLPRLWTVRVVAQQGVFTDCRNISCTLGKRWGSSEVQPELSYIHNPGTRPLLETTIGRLVESAAENWPEREFVVSLHQNRRITYSDLLKRADRIAAGFKEIGLRKGDRIGIWGTNELEWVLSYMAGARAGLIVAGINPAYRQDELNYCLHKIGARAVVASESHKTQRYPEMLLECKKKSATLEHVIVYSEDHITGTRRLRDIEELAGRKDVEAVKEEQVEISPLNGTNIQFTSGTTGTPKATLLSHRSFVNNARQGVARIDTDARKVCLNVPFFHAYGMIMGVVGPLHAGSTIVLGSPSFDPVKSIQAIMQEKCSVCFGTPTMWTNMIDVQIRTGARIDSLYTGATGGAMTSLELYKRIRKHLRLENIKTVFGMTEATALVNQSLLDEPQELTNTTVGYISDHIEIKVIDENGKMVPFGTAGELCVKGYNTMMGYWDDEESTSKAFLEGEWLRTGDRYILRKDGYGHIVGRFKDMLIRGGENIFPKEIEHFLEAHPGIIEAHAFGVHDDVYGEETCACLKLRSGAKLTAEDVKNYAKGKIAHFKIPRYIEFRDEFPKTTSGKIQKFRLKEELEERGFVPKKPVDN